MSKGNSRRKRCSKVQTLRRNLELNYDLLMDRLAAFDPESELCSELTQFGELFSLCSTYAPCCDLRLSELRELENCIDECNDALMKILNSFQEFLTHSPAAATLLRVSRTLEQLRNSIRERMLPLMEDQVEAVLNFDIKMAIFQKDLDRALPSLESIEEIPDEWKQRLARLVELWRSANIEVNEPTSILDSLLSQDAETSMMV